jgi:Protein of unknown function (DUF2851)
MISERLLHFIWQFQYFNKAALQTVDGEAVEIIYQGSYNTNQGPDFLDAKIKIGNAEWAGNIELHINTSDWNKHKHSDDKNYKNVIAHIVWNNDTISINNLPIIVLQDRVPKLLLEKYQQLLDKSTFIPCEKMIGSVPEITWISWKERLLVERLEQKSNIVFEYLSNNNNHWEETFWWMIAKNFGIKVNSEAFEKIAQSISINVLAKHKNQIHQIEALLFGQAGLLNDNFKEDYPILLKKEYQFYKTKYNLQQPSIAIHFLRMRPANFPTLRLAQLAMLVVESVHLFSKIKDENDLANVKKLLNVTANDYWHYHYTFDEPSTHKIKNLGVQMINNIIINTIVPVLFAYGHYHKDFQYKEKALKWFIQIEAEKNSIINRFSSLQIKAKSAFDSQALLQLKNEYCTKKRCLECAIGNKLLKN